MPRYNLEAIVLKHLNHKDADKIFTVFSKTQGKITVFAKGVRKVSSRRGGNLDTLNHVVIGISETTEGYKYITEVQSKNSFKQLKKSLPDASKGFYVAELVYKFLEGEHANERENERLFNLLLKTLKLLDMVQAGSEYAVNFFELSLMSLLGYELTFERCAVCGKDFSPDWAVYKVNLGLGGFICGTCELAGLQLTKPDALYLNMLARGKLPKNGGAYKQADEILKMYVKGVQEGEFKSLQAFGG